ncbi:hypothetical protein EJB05_11593, partial [Eragrostis curvula]
MGSSRRFLNLIVDNGVPGCRSLYCVDPTRFFNTTHNGNGSGESKRLRNAAATCAPAAVAGNKKNDVSKMESLQLPNPIFNLGASRSDPNEPRKIDCFPLVDRRLICADHHGRSYLFEADTRRVVTLPRLHAPNTEDVDDRDCGGGTLFVMERVPEPQPAAAAGVGSQFEAFVYRKPRSNRYFKSWDCQLLLPPPYVRDAATQTRCPEITSYGVVNDGSHVFISVDGIGTYFLDAESHTWSEVREWTMPFYGKVEYAPDPKLWFGVSAATNAQVLAAADLSMDSQPQLVGDCKELDLPEGWKQCKESQLVNLGSGKLCIARTPNVASSGDESVEQSFTVLTGVEVVPHLGNGSNGVVEFRMIARKSEYHASNGSGTIQAVF